MVYFISNTQVHYLKKDISEAYRQLAEEKEALHVLKAEWSYLNTPERLENLVDKHLRLSPVEVSQVTKVYYPAIAGELGKGNAIVDLKAYQQQDNILASMKTIPEEKPLLGNDK